MKINKYCILTLVSIILLFAATLILLWNFEVGSVDKVNANDLLKTMEETGKEAPLVAFKQKEYHLEYDYVAGTPVLYYDNVEQISQAKKEITIILLITMLICILMVLAYYFYVENRVLRPFRRLKGFAGEIAAGNLELSLNMDKSNIFGAFTESFDLMREDLKAAKESERKASQSKKELVASLSHDIKTPLSSIMTISELLTVTTTDEAAKQKLIILRAKAEQIEVLVNNLFHSALEELQELKVGKVELASTELKKMLLAADYEHKVEDFIVEACLIYCDPMRIQQVFDNLISNSYKYADTPITINTKIEGDRFYIRIEDQGDSLDPEELPLLKRKYYRGRNSNGKSGTGIGLFVSDYFMDKMGGSLELADCSKGFAVVLSLQIV